MNFYQPFLLLGIIITFMSSLLLTDLMEYIESKTNLGTSFVGSIITPLLTSVPELVIFIISVFIIRTEVGNQIGIGTIFGQPFMTSTISYSLVGTSTLIAVILHKRKGTSMIINKDLSIPYAFICVLFPLLILPNIFNSLILQYLLGIIFLSSYVIFTSLMYKKRSYQNKGAHYKIIFMTGLPSRVASIVQLAATLAGLYFGSKLMVDSLATLSLALGVNALALSILIIPIATSIPETLSAMIWAFRGNDSLSISSLVGEKTLYSTFYPALGLFSVQWIHSRYSEATIVFTTIVSLVFLLYIKKGKIPIYILFIGFIFFLFFVLLLYTLQTPFI
jgi:cation:H+ antiporter